MSIYQPLLVRLALRRVYANFKIVFDVLRKQKLLMYSDTSCKSEEFLGALLKPVIRQLEGIMGLEILKSCRDKDGRTS